jgi:hypothetical protein
MSALVALLNQIVDYAGLFPPAGLDMESVVRNYGEYQKSSQRWMLSRVIVPALQLKEFEGAASEFLPQDELPWRISALVPAANDDKFEQAIDAINQFNLAHQTTEQGLAVVDAVEIKANSAELIQATARGIPADINVFIEIPHADDPESLMGAIADESRTMFAKIRTGGVVADLIPDCQQVARFIQRCVAADVGLKATAGLHHPIRSEFNLTYEPDSDRATMHGFVNMFMATCLAWNHQLSEIKIGEILADGSRENFVFSGDVAAWHDLNISESAIRELRNSKAISFGSCSFTEPVQELQQLGFGSAFAETV